MKQLYQDLVVAKVQQGERIDKLSYDRVASMLRKQAETIKRKKGWTDVDFEVTEKGGKTFFKIRKKGGG